MSTQEALAGAGYLAETSNVLEYYHLSVTNAVASHRVSVGIVTMDTG